MERYVWLDWSLYVWMGRSFGGGSSWWIYTYILTGRGSDVCFCFFYYLFRYSALFVDRFWWKVDPNMATLERAREWDLDVDGYLNRVIPPSPLHKLPTPVSRFLGYRKEKRQDVGNVLGAVWSFVGAFCGLAVVAGVFNNTASIQWHQPPALIASFVSVFPVGSLEMRE